MTVALLTVATACSISDGSSQESTKSDDITEELFSDRTSSFPEFYETSSGEEISIFQTMGSFIVPRSFREMVEISDVIVIGESLESIEDSEVRISRSVSDGLFDGAFSVTEFRIEKALKGDFQVSDNIISIGQSVVILSGEDFGMPGSEASTELQLVLFTQENYRPIKAGAKYILFLRKGLAQGSDVYFPTGNTTGRVNIDGTDELTANLSMERKIRGYAIDLCQAVVQNPDQNPVDTINAIIEQSAQDFIELPSDVGNIGAERLPDNIPDVEVEAGPQTTEVLPPANQR